MHYGNINHTFFISGPPIDLLFNNVISFLVLISKKYHFFFAFSKVTVFVVLSELMREDLKSFLLRCLGTKAHDALAKCCIITVYSL